MRITIDTKEDSAQEIQHVINVLQQILARDHHTSQAAQMGMQHGYAQEFQSSSSTAPYAPPSHVQPPPPPLSMFDTPKTSPAPPSYSNSSGTGLPGMSSIPSMTIRSSQERPQSQQQLQQTPSIFDIFGGPNDKPAKSTTTQETANDLLNYDKEHDNSQDSSYTFTTY